MVVAPGTQKGRPTQKEGMVVSKAVLQHLRMKNESNVERMT